jgi:putative Holliday junction resolvase
MPRILAIDYGEKRFGLAQTDPLNLFAQPLETVPSTLFESWLKQYLLKETIQCFVVGLPKRLSGEDTHSTQRVKDFILWLQSQYPQVPVHTIDERYSSKEAQYHILEMGKTKQQRKEKGLIDTVAATLILQTYLQQISA